MRSFIIGRLLPAIGFACGFGSAAHAACTLAQPPNMILGNYTGAQSDAGSINLHVTCTAGSANYNIPMSGGASGNTAARTLRSGVVSLNYFLRRDAARTQNWGNVNGTDTYAGNGSTPEVMVPVYPRLPAGQRVAPGTYVDTIATGSRQFTVTATVLPSCTISATPLAFGTYRGVVLDSSSSLSVSCTNTTSYTIGLSAGVSSGATATTRAMTVGAIKLSYALTRDAARTQNWGQTAGVDTVAGTGNGAPQAITVWGRIAASQYRAPGTYADTIVATITY